MRPAVLRRLAVFAALAALAVPVAAQANEVTNWNSIAQTTTPRAAAARLGAAVLRAVMMAMVQGAVYGAVNAIDRQHRPYLVHRRFLRTPRRRPLSQRPLSASSTRSSRRSMQCSRRSTTRPWVALPDGRPKDQGIEVGTLAAEAMLAGGHDGRGGPIPPLPPPGPGHWQPLIGPDGNPLLDPSPWVALAQPFLIRSGSSSARPGRIR